ncbi:hypothetical protein COOONC_00471 [Cooperia oncophora]
MAYGSSLDHKDQFGYSFWLSACALVLAAADTVIAAAIKRGGIVSEWDETVPHVVYAYNISPHEATNESPFFIIHGFDPVFPSNVIPSDELSPYRMDIDDYKASLMSGVKIIQEKSEKTAKLAAVG